MNGDFTIECWVYLTVITSNTTIIDQMMTYAGGAGNWQFTGTSSTGLGFYYNGNLNNISGSGFATNTWYHLAAVRYGTTVNFFVNGISQGTATYSATIGSNNTLWVGAQHYNGPQAYMSGNVTNVRMINGTALYTSNFIPSTAPLLATNNTKLLLNVASSAYITDSSTNNYTVTNTGPATYSTSTPFLTSVLFLQNNQTTIQNGTTYQYSSATGAWTRVSGTATTLTVQGVSVVNTTRAVSSSSGAVVVAGGVGIGGDLYVGGNITINGSLPATVTGTRRTTSATSPANPSVGDLWYWTVADAVMRYTYDGVSYYWVDITGPTVTAGQYTIPTSAYIINYLVVAGGGAGGNNGAGSGSGAGGGAGGLLTGTTSTTPGTVYTITVGSGGSAVTTNAGAGGSGTTSTFGLITTLGGGGGSGAGGANGVAGGSGGGAGGSPGTGGSGTPGQGNNGGNGAPGAGGGGGGAGAVGGAAVTSTAGAGGTGTYLTITGSAVAYAGGGGGNGTVGGGGGTGGGGAGSSGTSGAGAVGTAGTAFTGGGGGGGSGPAPGYVGPAGAAGGSGVVIISYQNPSQRGSGGTVTTYNPGAGTYYVHTFTATGSYTA